jgi:hypothetical protein
MGNGILIGWDEIYEKLFCNGSGKPSFSIHTLMIKHGPGLKACGAVFSFKRGHQRTHCIAGWRIPIQNYFIKLGQQEEAARLKFKAEKRANKP